MDRGPGEGGHALDDGHLAVYLDVGPHAAELIHIAVAAVPHPLGEDAGAVGQTQDGGDLGLHIGGEARVGHGLYIGAADGAAAADPDGVVQLLHLHPHLHQLGGDAVQVLGDDILNEHIPAGGGHGGHIGTGFDLVGDDGVGSAPELLHAPDLDDVGARPHDVGPHGVEEVGQVHDVRLLGGVLNDGHAVGQHGGQHDVHGSPHGHHVQIYLSAGQTAAGHFGADEAAAHIHVGPHGHKALHMLVNGPSAQVAAPGQGDLRPAEASQQSAHQVVAGADLPGQLVGDLPVADVGTVDVHGGAVDGADVRPQLLEDLENQSHVADLGNIFNAAYPVHQKGGGDDGDSGVFGAADGDASTKGLSALNVIFCQIWHPLDPYSLDWGLYKIIRPKP